MPKNPLNIEPEASSTQPSSRKVLGLFAKFWQPGAVKTRLAKRVGDDPACAIYVEFVAHLLKRFANTADHRYLVYSPADQETEFKSFCQTVLSKDTWQRTPQVDSDLGARMRSFFEQQFETGIEKVIVIGADSPQLTAAMIEHSFTQLDHHDAVIGPSTDGGYYLIGMRQKCLDIFSGIQWGGSLVYPATIAQLQRLNASHFDLPALTDVDEYHDLEALHCLLSDRQRESDFDSLDARLLRYVDTFLQARTES